MDNGLIVPPGEMVSAGGTRFHVRRFGSSSERTFILEAGLTMFSSCWAWIAPELAKLGMVIAYDRAGLGWSEERHGLRDAKQIAEELTGLSAALNVSEKKVLVGHSMGSFFNRAVLKQNPGFANAVVWLDPTHPRQLAHSRRMQRLFFYLEAANRLAAGDLPTVTLSLISHLEGLPPQEFQAVKTFLESARHLKATAREARAWKMSAEYIHDTSLGDIPLLVISAQKNALRRWGEYQKELAAVSNRAEHVTFTEMSHLSMLSNREQALKVSEKIAQFAAKI